MVTPRSLIISRTPYNIYLFSIPQTIYPLYTPQTVFLRSSRPTPHWRSARHGGRHVTDGSRTGSRWTSPLVARCPPDVPQSARCPRGRASWPWASCTGTPGGKRAIFLTPSQRNLLGKSHAITSLSFYDQSMSYSPVDSSAPQINYRKWTKANKSERANQ